MCFCTSIIKKKPGQSTDTSWVVNCPTLNRASLLFNAGKTKIQHYFQSIRVWYFANKFMWVRHVLVRSWLDDTVSNYNCTNVHYNERHIYAGTSSTKRPIILKLIKGLKCNKQAYWIHVAKIKMAIDMTSQLYKGFLVKLKHIKNCKLYFSYFFIKST